MRKTVTGLTFGMFVVGAGCYGQTATGGGGSDGDGGGDGPAPMLDGGQIGFDTGGIDAGAIDVVGNDVFASDGAISDSASDSTFADVTFDVTPPPPGVAGVAFVINGVVQTPMSCPSDDWEFAPFPMLSGPDAGCSGDPNNPFCSGVTSVYLVNTGQVPVAYYATDAWLGMNYVPGVLTGASFEVAGVMDPGSMVDITSVYDGGITALLGSAEPFSNPDANRYLSDEGTIPWPAGVAGSGGATQMQIAEIEVFPACRIAIQVW